MPGIPPLPACPSCAGTSWRVPDRSSGAGWWWANARRFGRRGALPPDELDASLLRIDRTVCNRCRVAPPADVAEAAATYVWWRMRVWLARVTTTGVTGRDPGPRWVPPDDALD